MNTALIASGEAPQPAVTLITALAVALDISDAEYRAIYARVAAGRSLRNVALALQSEVSFGWWAAYANGEKTLDRDRRNELRRWARVNGGPELADLPPTPVEAVAAHVHPDAAVYRVGEQVASRVVLVGSDVPAVELRINGNCRVAANCELAAESDAQALGGPVAACNGRYSRLSTKAIRLHPETFGRLQERKAASGLSWDQYVARAEYVDELVAALAEVERWLDPDEDAMEDVEHWGEYERLTAMVRNALEAVRQEPRPDPHERMEGA